MDEEELQLGGQPDDSTALLGQLMGSGLMNPTIAQGLTQTSPMSLGDGTPMPQPQQQSAGVPAQQDPLAMPQNPNADLQKQLMQKVIESLGAQQPQPQGQRVGHRLAGALGAVLMGIGGGLSRDGGNALSSYMNHVQGQKNQYASAQKLQQMQNTQALKIAADMMKHADINQMNTWTNQIKAYNAGTIRQLGEAAQKRLQGEAESKQEYRKIMGKRQAAMTEEAERKRDYIKAQTDKYPALAQSLINMRSEIGNLNNARAYKTDIDSELDPLRAASLFQLQYNMAKNYESMGMHRDATEASDMAYKQALTQHLLQSGISTEAARRFTSDKNQVSKLHQAAQLSMEIQALQQVDPISAELYRRNLNDLMSEGMTPTGVREGLNAPAPSQAQAPPKRASQVKKVELPPGFIPAPPAGTVPAGAINQPETQGMSAGPAGALQPAPEPTRPGAQAKKQEAPKLNLLADWAQKKGMEPGQAAQREAQLMKLKELAGKGDKKAEEALHRAMAGIQATLGAR